MESERKLIAPEYRDFYDLATKLAEEDMKYYTGYKPYLNKRHKQTPADFKLQRFNNHIRYMVYAMYQIRYGDADERLRIMDYLDNNGVTVPDNVEKQILSGEYKDLTEMGGQP